MLYVNSDCISVADGSSAENTKREWIIDVTRVGAVNGHRGGEVADLGRHLCRGHRVSFIRDLQHNHVLTVVGVGMVAVTVPCPLVPLTWPTDVEPSPQSISAVCVSRIPGSANSTWSDTALPSIPWMAADVAISTGRLATET